MSLSDDLISQYVEVNAEEKEKKEETLLGKIVSYNGKQYVKLDGSDQLTPIASTSSVDADDRVTVLLKNHSAIVTGNLSYPSAKNSKMTEISDKVDEFGNILAYSITTENIDAINAYFENLTAITANYENMEAVNAEIERLKATYANLDHVTAKDVEALNADIENLRATFVNATNISAEDLNAANAEINNLKAYNANFTYVSADVLSAINGKITNLDATYANIDFANISEAAVEKFYAVSGIIQNLTLETGVVVKELIGVLISGDLIKGNTIQADKLIVRGEDGLYYKLNVDALGETTASADPKYQNGLDGSVIVAKSVTAEKVSVDDLVAFGATIGGFHITNNAIYSGAKESATNTTRGLYLDNDGQIALGDANNYLKFYKKDGTNYVFEMSLVEAVQEGVNATAESISSLPTQDDLAGLQNQITEQGGTISGLKETAGKLESNISANAKAVEGLGEKITSSDSKISELNTTINELLGPAEYIRKGTIVDTDGNTLPCLELGKEGSDFKVRITNEQIQFIDGQTTPAYITNKKLMIENAEVKNELRFGNFVWKKRENGNMGLTWEEVSS